MTSRTDIRVRYADTDQMGVVYYSKYLEYFEVGRTELFREIALPYSMLEKEGVFFPVVECECAYKRPARYDDVLTIVSSVNEVGRASWRVDYEIYRKEDSALIASGFTRHASVNSNGKPISLPEKLKDRLKEK
jgi:acyl-CoA thioester hydrolase